MTVKVKKIRTLLLLTAVLFLMLFTSAVVLAADKTEIVFGYSAPITGSMSHVGEKIKHGYTIWQEMVNDKGGIYVKKYKKKLLVKLKLYDDKSDPTTSAKLYEKLITTDKVDFVCGYQFFIEFGRSGRIRFVIV